MPAPVYHYEPLALDFLAIIFAPGFIHLGSKVWVETLNLELDLSGKKVLDFGSGAGGPACYLAKHTDAQVLGVEFDAPLHERSLALAAEMKLTNRAEFVLLKDLPLPSHTKFDVLMSIDTLDHCKDKGDYFAEFNRALRSSGTLAIMDWFHKSPRYSTQTQAFFDFSHDIFYLSTAQEYLQLLEKNNFNYVNFKDNTKAMRQLCEELIMLMKSEYHETLIATFGAEYYEWWFEYWSLLYAALQTGDLLTGSVKGVKI